MSKQSGKPGVMLYFEAAERMRKLKPLQRLSVYDAIVQYGKDGTVPELKREADLVFSFIKPILDRDEERYQRVRSARTRAGRARGAQMKEEVKRKEREHMLNLVSIESQSTIPNLQSPIYNPQSTIPNLQSPVSNPQSTIPNPQSPVSNLQSSGDAGEGPPSLEEVKDYVVFNGLRFCPEDFVDYYTANGWTVGGVPVRDWRALARRWSRNERERTQEVTESYGIVV